MVIKDLVETDFINYKRISMFIAFPKCTFKCDKEANCQICQNSHLAKQRDIAVTPEFIVHKYESNPLTKAIVLGGLEPFDSFTDLVKLIREIRKVTDDDIVIYTGYTETEKYNEVYKILAQYKNIVIKFGRYIPNQKKHLDDVLGVYLASDNQYGIKIS